MLVSEGALHLGSHSTRSDLRITRSSATALHHIAEELGRAGPRALAHLKPQERALLQKQAEVALAYAAKQRRLSATAALSRAAGAAILVELIRSQRAGSAPRYMTDVLLQAAEREHAQTLRRAMILGLGALAHDRLTPTQKSRVALLEQALDPKAPPLAAWLKNNPKGPIELRHYVGSEFFASERAAYKREGWMAQKEGPRRVIFERQLPGPNGPVLVRSVVYNDDRHILRDLGDSKVHLIVYSGHSDLGHLIDDALDSAPRQRGEKVFLDFSCRGKQSLRRLSREQPRLHTMVSDEGTLKEDDMKVYHALLPRIVAGQDYRALRRTIHQLSLETPDNYLLPGDPRRLPFIDSDNDGRPDSNRKERDYLAHVGLRRSLGRRNRYVPDPNARADRLAGEPVAQAVQYFNTVYSYYLEDYGSRAARAAFDGFLPDGWYATEKPDPSEVVRVSEAVRGQKKIYQCAVHAQWAKLAPDALGALVAYALTVDLEARLHPGRDADVARLRGLAMAASYIETYVPYIDMADALMTHLCAYLGLPRLGYDAVRRAVRSDSYHDGCDKWVASLKRSLAMARNTESA